MNRLIVVVVLLLGTIPAAAQEMTIFDLNANGPTEIAATPITDASGDYVANLPPGLYAVVTNDNHGHINEIYDNVPCSSSCDTNAFTPIDVASSPITGIDFVLDPGGRIAGTITSAATGLPIPNVRVNFVDPGGQLIFTSALTDAAGNYLSDGGSATGNVFAFTDNTQGYRDEAYDNVYCLADCDPTQIGTAIAVTVGATTNNINFVLDTGGRITGTVTDANAAPLEGVYVNVIDSTGTQADQVLTDALGTYSTAGLPAGSYFAVTFNTVGSFGYDCGLHP